ncbi:cupredoxin family protein [Roseateles sp.]|uniref:cupredoxin domain-containing protein n=1 Tax=Roseateles sp. TaxID=1971397 RepID=UPI0025E28A09|nr:cupredoxin family protein [Roseateles sp.]MBV8037134.1 cupredoxin family protein [Roseateles sp.]
MTLKSIPTLAALVLAAGASLAGGQHADGHDDGAIGRPGIAAQATRTVRIDMSDAMRFTPSSVAVKQGETVRFVVKNSGRLKHEMVLGTEKELKAHDELMKKNPEMEHADDNMVSVAPGRTGEIVWRFTRAGKITFACLQPGHYDAGMKGTVQVAGKDGHADHEY